MDIWIKLEKHASRKSIEDAFQNLPDQDLQEIKAYLSFLIAENLIADSSNSDEHVSEPFPSFVKPQYAKFEDMANLIMIDPIHEADQTKGWPNKAQ
jgi:hypothetical protein